MTGYWSTLVASAFDRTEQHQPTDRNAMRVAAVELRQRGLTDRDIASALRLCEGAVRDLFGEVSYG